ncbi:MAG TPA: Mov34/MPN/PAD-1 family protein [Actinospica sp.]|jgi:proteasome lid subunit RPN8/RPN11|nr:Mov34/MPN/PAD-1 family protein [Actinospica sp.]
MLIIRRAVLDAVLAHACSGHPDISCGFVAGQIGSDRPERHVPMRNAEPSRTYWRFDPLEQVRAWTDMDDRGEEPVVIYYSQDLPDAVLSKMTISYAVEEQAHYLVVSTFRPDEPRYRSFRVRDGRAVEDEIAVLDEPVIEDQISDRRP